MKLASVKLCKDLKVRIVTAVPKMKKNEGLELNEQHEGQEPSGFVTHSSIELHEPLLEEQ